MGANFQPQYILDTELAQYGLPLASCQADIITQVKAASTLIDEHCGRIDSDGNGSLVYSTYEETLYLPENRNIVRLAYRPLAPIDANVKAALSVSGIWDTGFEPNTIYQGGTTRLSPLLSASGWYGYGRRGDSRRYIDSPFGGALIGIVNNFGGPPAWQAIAVEQTEFNVRTGEIWVPAGLYLSNYSEIKVRYNAGFDPRTIPPAIKHACAALVKNLLSRGSGTTGIKGISGAGKISTQFTESLIDPTIETWLAPYVTVVAL